MCVSWKVWFRLWVFGLLCVRKSASLETDHGYSFWMSVLDSVAAE